MIHQWQTCYFLSKQRRCWSLASWCERPLQVLIKHEECKRCSGRLSLQTAAQLKWRRSSLSYYYVQAFSYIPYCCCFGLCLGWTNCLVAWVTMVLISAATDWGYKPVQFVEVCLHQVNFHWKHLLFLSRSYSLNILPKPVCKPGLLN